MTPKFNDGDKVNLLPASVEDFYGMWINPKFWGNADIDFDKALEFAKQDHCSYEICRDGHPWYISFLDEEEPEVYHVTDTKEFDRYAISILHVPAHLMEIME